MKNFIKQWFKNTSASNKDKVYISLALLLLALLSGGNKSEPMNNTYDNSMVYEEEEYCVEEYDDYYDIWEEVCY